MRKLRFDRHSLAALLATTVVVMSMSGSLWVIFQTITVLPDESAQETAQWLNANTPTDALIESYESELFVFLDRPYHFPPDSIQIPLTRRTFLQEDVSPDYDPLVADPDYLVSGPSDRLFDLYTEAKDSRQFRLLTTIGWYTVYERQR